MFAQMMTLFGFEAESKLKKVPFNSFIKMNFAVALYVFLTLLIFSPFTGADDNEICFDKGSNCKQLESYCWNESYRNIMKEYCSKTCAVCSLMKSDCFDKDQEM